MVLLYQAADIQRWISGEFLRLAAMLKTRKAVFYLYSQRNIFLFCLIALLQYNPKLIENYQYKVMS